VRILLQRSLEVDSGRGCIFGACLTQAARHQHPAAAEQRFDVLVLGGGINGAVSAAALAARGVKVALIDRGDFASVTSQQSSNLAWGGIKYLEASSSAWCASCAARRNKLLRSFPSIVQEIRFYVRTTRLPPRAVELIPRAWLYWVIGSFSPRRGCCRSATSSEKSRSSRLERSTADSNIRRYLRQRRALVWSFIRSALDALARPANSSRRSST